MGRRVLVTGLASFWGTRTAAALTSDPSVDAVIGLDRDPPAKVPGRTRFVATDERYSNLTRIVADEGIDTLVHSFLVVDSTRASARDLHETNVIGTMNLCAAATGTSVRQVVVKSSTLVYGSRPGDPTYFEEDTAPRTAPRGAVARSLVEVEAYVRDFALDNPSVAVAVLRFANVVGPTIDTALTRALLSPLVPAVGGFDPRLQLVDEADVVRAICFVVEREVRGTYNVAADGLVPWRELAAICGRRTVSLPPLATSLAARPLARLGLELPPELLDLLRHGRGVDNGRLRRAGFSYTRTTAGAAAAFARDRVATPS